MLVIERANASDEAFVLSLAPRFAETRPDWRSYSEVAEGTAAQLRAAFARAAADEVIFIARDGAERLGFAFVATHDDFFTGKPHAHLSEIAVTHDSGGAGRALMDAAQAWALGRGARYLSLNVNENNARARRFYERLGFGTEHRHLVKLLSS